MAKAAVQDDVDTESGKAVKQDLIKIAVDAMGSDHCPAAEVEGAIALGATPVDQLHEEEVHDPRRAFRHEPHQVVPQFPGRLIAAGRLAGDLTRPRSYAWSRAEWVA